MSALFHGSAGRRIGAILVLAGAVFCGYWSLRLAWADWLAREGTPQAAEKSLKLAPGNSEYLKFAAITAEDSGGDGTVLRSRLVQVNPLDSKGWIQLSSGAEMHGRTAEAERDLLRAYDVDHQFEPRWALANFYFRSGDREKALEWARKTLEFARGNLDAVFQLCWNAAGDGKKILEHAIPMRADVLGEYLQYLEATGRLEDAGAVAARLLPVAEAEQAPAIASYSSRCLSEGRVNAAISAWNGLLQRGLMQGEAVEPRAGKLLVNANFERNFSGIGFDWSAPPVDGVVVERLANGRGVRIVFSRNEPESCGILSEYVALLPGHGYRFRCRYETNGMSGVGVKWIVRDFTTKAIVAAAEASGGDAGGEQSLGASFRTPQDWRLATLELRYERSPGTVRPEGWMRFSHLELEEAP